MKKGDVAIFFTFALICILLFLHSFFPKDNLVAVVWKDGEIVEETVLSQIEKPYTKKVAGCTLRFEKGAVKFASSNCRDRLCTKHAKLSKAGDTMACVPNRVVVSIKSGGEQYDAVAY